MENNLTKERSYISDTLSTLKKSIIERKEKPINILFDIFMSLVAFFFSATRTVFGVCPFGIALLAVSGRRVIPIFVGTLLGTIMLDAGGVGYLLILSLLFVMRLLFSLPFRQRVYTPFSRSPFCEAPQIRIALSVVCGFLLGVYELFFSNFAYYAILFALGSLIFTLLSAILFIGVYLDGFSLEKILSHERAPFFAKVNHLTLYSNLSLAAVSSAFVYSLSGYEYFGISLPLSLAFVLLTLISVRVGALYGAISGGVSALLISPVYAAAFSAAALVLGLCKKIGMLYSLILSVFLLGSYSLIFSSVSGFLDVFPSVAVPALLIWPLIKDGDTVEEEKAEKCENPARLERLSSVFSDLSEVFYNLSDSTSRPAISEYFTACDSICSRWCKNCPSKSVCWESGERYAYNTMKNLSQKLYRRGVTDDACIPDALTDRCPYIDEMVMKIRESCARLACEKQKSDRSEMMATDYEMIAKLLRESAKNDMLDLINDKKTAKKIKDALIGEFKIPDAEAECLGKRKKTVNIYTKRADRLFDVERALTARISDLCCCYMGKMRQEKEGCVTLESLAIYGTEFAYRSLAKDRGEVCGDNVSLFDNEDERFYALICDGMGTGKGANASSGFASVFLSKMLSSSMSKNTSISMLNNFLRCKGTECSTTLDLFEFDKITACASVTKSGAAPSFVIRNKNVFKIKSKTLPIGLMKNVDSEKTDFELTEGDTLIMMSDGVSADPEEEDWFLNLLSKFDRGISCASLCDEIIKAAKKNSKKTDDMTVLCVKITKKAVRAEFAMQKSAESY